MSEKAVKFVKVGKKDIPLIDNGNVPIVFADLAVEARFQGGTVYLALASSSTDGRGTLEAELCARIRMPLVAWESLKRSVDAAIGTAEASRAPN